MSDATALGLIPSRPAFWSAITPDFVRAGAALEKPARARLAAINERLASLGTQFGQNVLADEQSFTMILDEADLAGLPDFVRAAARAAARGARSAGQICDDPVALAVEPFLQFSSRRDLREKAFPRLDHPWRQRWSDRQPRYDRRDGGLAGRAGTTVRLSDLLRLSARRRHGEDAGGGARASG